MTQQDKNNVKVTFNGGASVVIEELDERQQAQLSAILEESGVLYSWHSWLVAGPSLRRKFPWWWRLNRWLMPLLFITVLSMPALAQKALEPLKVTVIGDADGPTGELVSDVRHELAGLRDVVITVRRADYEVWLNVEDLQRDGHCKGYAAAVLVVRRSDGFHELTVFVGPDLGQVAGLIVETVNKEHFAPFRGGAFSRRK